MKKRWIAVVIIIIFIIGFIGINIWSESTGARIVVEVTNIKKEIITEMVMTLGRLNPVDEQSIYASPENGDVAEIFVKQGDEVKQGTTLFQYENDQLKLEKKQNELNLQSSYLQLNYLKEQHKELDKQLEDDEDNEIIQDEHDQINLEQQRANIEAELVLLQKESIEKQIADLEVKSEISGRVIEVNKPTNSNQLEQQPFILIVSMGKLKVEGTISEYDILKIKKGQTATLTSDAVPDSSWEGKISYISHLPVEGDSHAIEGGKGSVQYPIEIVLEDQEISIKSGFQVIIEIITDEHKAMTLPLTAVKQDGDSNYVYIVKDGISKRHEIKVGSVSNQFIEITEGLTETDQVITKLDKNVVDGMEVIVK